MSKVPLNHLLKIGADALQTTAQTLSGAINELKTAIASIVDEPQAQWHTYEGNIETITVAASSAWQYITFHGVDNTSSVGIRTIFRVVTDHGNVILHTPGAYAAAANPNGGSDFTYRVKCPVTNTHFRLLKIIPKA
jgi:hypothetical protein